MAIIFYWLDIKSVNMNTYYNTQSILEVRALLKQIYKNTRYLVSNNPTIRATLNLETKEDGIYITDIAFGTIDSMIEYCIRNGYTAKRMQILVYELNNLEVMIKNILQYYHYFLRPNFAQKPDVDIAVEKYKLFADQRTIEELKEIVGKKNRIDFESLGSDKLELNMDKEEDPDENVNLSDDYNKVKDDDFYDEGNIENEAL